MTDLAELSQRWLQEKHKEDAAKEERRKIEDEMLALAHIPENADGTNTLRLDNCTVKIVSRINRTVNSDKLQELAAENGLTDHLSSLFRWKPEINMEAWKNASYEITIPLSGAITAKPGRHSFSITQIEE